MSVSDGKGEIMTGRTRRLGERLTEMCDAAHGPQEVVSTGAPGMALYVLCNTVSMVTGNDDDDETARDAAYLMNNSPAARAASEQYAAQEMTLESYASAVADAIRELEAA